MAIYNGGLNIIAQDISGKEDKSNKVTTWSSTTTDTNYPSEKLVKDALDTKVNTANVLTLEEIQATTDLTGKVASASALKEINFEKHTPVLNSSYVTGEISAYTVNGMPRVIARLITAEPIPAWKSLIWNLPSRPLNDPFNFYDTEHKCLFQYHPDGFIQSAQDVPAGWYSIII